MTTEEKEAIIVDLAAKVKNASNTEIEAIKLQLGNLDSEALKALLKADLSDLEKIKGLTTEVKELTESVKLLKDNATSNENPRESLIKEIKEKKDEIKGIVKGSRKEVTIKALVTRASIANNTESVRLAGIGQLGYRRRALYDYFTKFPVGRGNHDGTISYMDFSEADCVNAAAAIAEGGTYPEDTAEFAEFTQKLKKIGTTLPVTDEFGEDEVLAAAELDNFLRNNVNSVVDNQIAVGPGTSNTLLGLMAQVPVFTASASDIPDANIKDLVRKMRTGIVKTRGSKYAPNFVAMNSDTIDEYILKKDANNNYMFDEATGQVGGLDIVEDNNIPDNQLVVGDAVFGRIYEMSGVVLSEGLVGAQFKEDKKTIKARTRLLFIIRNVDRTGFLKSTDIADDLITLES